MAGRAKGARVALDTLILGHHGEIHAGETIPETYDDWYGNTYQTDFKRLEQAGYAAPAPAPEPEPKRPAAKPSK